MINLDELYAKRYRIKTRMLGIDKSLRTLDVFIDPFISDLQSVNNQIIKRLNDIYSECSAVHDDYYESYVILLNDENTFEGLVWNLCEIIKFRFPDITNIRQFKDLDNSNKWDNLILDYSRKIRKQRKNGFFTQRFNRKYKHHVLVKIG